MGGPPENYEQLKLWFRTFVPRQADVGQNFPSDFKLKKGGDKTTFAAPAGSNRPNDFKIEFRGELKDLAQKMSMNRAQQSVEEKKAYEDARTAYYDLVKENIRAARERSRSFYFATTDEPAKSRAMAAFDKFEQYVDDIKNRKKYVAR